MTITTSIEHEVAWLALLASGVEGSAGISRRRFAEELRRLGADPASQAQPDPSPQAEAFLAAELPFPQALTGVIS